MKPKPQVLGYGNGCSTSVWSICSVTSLALMSSSSSRMSVSAIRFAFWGDDHMPLRKFSGSLGTFWGNEPIAKIAVGWG